jgi:predicted ribosome quality control (RQC) complex YloA/Tae2 family protein
MEYKYLAAWVEQNKQKDLIFQELVKFRDQYAVKFKKTGTFLQINLASEDSFCFFSSDDRIPFRSERSLNKFNHILYGSRLNNISITENDRILFAEFTYLDLENKIKEYLLVIELIPRFLNFIILDKKSKKDLLIIDSLRKFSFAENPARQILPNQSYELPTSSYENIKEKIKIPLVFNRSGKIEYSGSLKEGYLSVNTLFNDLFYELILENRNKRLQENAGNKIMKMIGKKESKLVKLAVELQNTNKEESWKKWADLLKSNMYLVKPGMREITLKNYFSSEQEDITIPIREDLTALENVNLFYKKFKKARDGKKKIREQIIKTEEEVTVLRDQLNKVQQEYLYFENEKKMISSKKNTVSFRTLKVDENWEILIGRTSIENDVLTTKVARSYDWWFHTRIFKGTHVILRNFSKKEVLPVGLLNICCRIAAYFSKAKKSSNVPVDYTQIRYVRKPRKSPPGFVVYSNQKTLYVDPISLRDANDELKKWKKG